MSSTEIEAIEKILHRYFEGVYSGDVDKLRSVFDARSSLQAPGYRATRDEWLRAVAHRQSPQDHGEPFEFRVLSIEVGDPQAVAKVDAPMLGHRYTDYLSLLKEDGDWRIVNKTFADRE